MPIKKYLKWVIYFFVASVVMYLAANYALISDSSRQAMESFIASNEQIATKVGDVKEMRLIKRVSVSASDTSRPYRLYTFSIKGSKAASTVIVRAEQEESGSTERFFIDDISR